MRLSLGIACLLLFTASCRQQQPEAQRRSWADSALAAHFARIATLRHYDTTGFDHQLLQAIYRNDSVYLKRYLDEFPETYADRRITMFADSSMGLPPLYKLDADASYRFRTESAFAAGVNGSPMCNLRSYTISRSGDTVRLQVLYGLFEELDPITDWTFKTTIHYRHDTTLLLADWDALGNALGYCDYWGLKPTNDFRGKDGWALSIEGYARPAPNLSRSHHYIYRFAPNGTALDSPLAVIARLSGGWPPYY